MSSAANETVLSLRWPVDLGLTVASHGWANLAPWRWNAEDPRLSRIERIGARIGPVEIAQSDPSSIVVRWSGFDREDAALLFGRVRRWLSADWEPAEAIAALPEAAALIERGGGRMLRGSFFYEDFVKTVLTINTSWPSTCRMVAALVAEPGGGSFPGPVTLLEYGEDRLRVQGKLGFRARTLTAATRQMLDDAAVTPSGEGSPDRLDHDYLLRLYGIGPYAAAHCRVLLHDFSRIPVDTSVAAYLRERFGCNPADFAEARSAWGAYLALGYRLTRLRDRLEQQAPARSE